jgi:hypothetical protein
MLGVVIKIHIDEKPLRFDIKRALKNLRKICETKKIGSSAIIRDLALIPLTEWAYFIEMCYEIFKGSEINAVLLLNNIPIPCVEDRYKIVREYHETAVGGYRGMNKTFNMRPGVQQFVKSCIKCQTEKLVRVKTRLPMIISDTSSYVFEKISILFYISLNTTPEGYKHILSKQDCLSKYCILVPVKHANAEEVAKGLTEKMICYFEPPEFTKLFGRNKYCTTAYHPQSDGSIERMHHTLTEYLRKYVENKTGWNT